MIKQHNILFVQNGLDPSSGGLQRVSYLLGEEFRNKGCGVWYAYRNRDTDGIPASEKLYWGEKSSAKELYDKFDRYISEHNINLLICQNDFKLSTWSIIGKLRQAHKRLRVISCRHVCPEMSEKDTFGLDQPYFYLRQKYNRLKYKVKRPYLLFRNEDFLIMRKAYEVSDRYVFLSERYIPYASKVLGVDATSPKLLAIHNPVSFPPYTPCKKENILLVVGRMHEIQKKVSRVLKVWEALYKKHEDWSLYIVGGGPDLGYYQRKAKSMKLERCIFTGPSDNAKAYYDKAKIQLMTSAFEGLPMTVIEAQNSGCVPIVLDTFASVHDIIDGSNGIVVPGNDLEAFIASTEKLMTHEALLQKMSEKAIATCSERFNMRSVMERWDALIEDLDKE